MAKKLYEESNIAAIAEAIRAKNGKADTYTVAQMAGAIAEITAGGGGGAGDLALLVEESNKDNIKSFVVPEGIVKIKLNCFNYMVNLASLSLPSTLEELGTACFANCSSLPTLVLPARVKKINNRAFGACTALTEVTFKGTPESISTTTFDGCTQTMTINVPWAEGAVAGADTKWGATNATIYYNYKG